VSSLRATLSGVEGVVHLLGDREQKRYLSQYLNGLGIWVPGIAA
jgi:hypothetical protein